MRTSNQTIIFLFISLCIIVVWWYLPQLSLLSSIPEIEYNALNTLFSGLAFAGVIFTVLLQKKELQLQREELSNTREELRRAADAQQKSEEALKIQAESMKIQARILVIRQTLDSLEIYESSLKKTKDSVTAHRLCTKRKNSLLEELNNLADEILNANK